MATNGSQVIAIVGGGAIGAALFGTLVDRLSRKSWSQKKPRIAIFEKSGRVGPGLAYGKDAAPYLLNTSAQSMSMLPGERSQFFEWLGTRGLLPEQSGEHFCARQLFGDYAEESFARARDRAHRAGIGVSVIADEVLSITPRVGMGHRLTTRSLGVHDADTTVLALGNLPSTRFAALHGPGFFASPYPSEPLRAEIPRDARVAILGTGLSAIDAAIALFAAGHRAPVTLASRSGLLPAVRGPLPEHRLVHVTRANVCRATNDGQRPLRWPTILQWLSQELADVGEPVSWDRDFPATANPEAHLAAQIAAAESTTRAWQSVGEALNPMIEVLWHQLAEDERTLFLDRFLSRFMSHWVPIPLVTARRVLGLLRTGRLSVHGGLEDVARVSARSGADARFTLRFDSGAPSQPFDVIVNATGTPRHLAESASPLLGALLERGLAVPHPHGGARVDFHSLRMVDASGRLDPALYSIGNLTCGTHLFTSTLEHNLEKADRLASRVADDLHRRAEKEPHVDAAPHST